MKKLVSLMLAALLVLSCLAGVSFAANAEATWSDGTTTVEGSLLEMVKQASNAGGTVTLLQDCTSYAEKGAAVSSNMSFTLDLGGHTLQAVAMNVSISDKASGITVIKNGTLIGNKMNVSVKGGGLQMDGVTCWSSEQQNVSYATVSGDWNKDNLIQNCVFANQTWGAFSFNSVVGSQAKVAMAIKNTILLTNKKTTPIVIQEKALTGNLVLGEGVKMYSLGSSNFTNSNVIVTGEAVTKAEELQTVTAAGKTFEGMTMWSTPDTATKALEIPDLTSDASIVASWTDGSTTMEGTLVEIAKQASNAGGTVKLLKDVSVNAGMSFAKSVTIDLNGFTLTTTNNAINVTEKATGITVIKNGTIISGGRNLSVRKGGLQLQNVTLWSETAQNIDYYETSDAFNHDNIIENCTIGNPVWGCFSFNNTTANQEKASITVKNSTLVAAKAKGGATFVLQTKPEGSTANIVLGEGVKLYSYATGATAYTDKALSVLGETATKSAETASVTVAGKTYDLMTEWTTPAEGTVDLATVIPGAAPAAPAEPTAPAEPAKPAEPSKPAEDKKDEAEKPALTPAETKEGANVGVIIAIVAAVVVIAAVAVVVLKKKKK